MIRLLLLAFVSMLVLEGVVFAESGPSFSDTGPEAEAYGASKGYPVPPFEYPPGFRQDFMVGTYSHYDKLHPMRTVPKPATPSVLKRTAEEIVPVYHYDGRSDQLVGAVALSATDVWAVGYASREDSQALIEHFTNPCVTPAPSTAAH